ncbi:MAG TPA: threonine synthase [Thermoanaerobaculia bacterium]|nr:threonine synthase [Thermoanaerobaculia bacterium]
MQLTSTRDSRLRVGFKQAVLQNVPGDGGLFVPAELAPWPDVPALLALAWQERSAEILRRLLGSEYQPGELDEIVREAFDFPAPLVAAAEGSFALELFHGPSLAFKDFGARFLAAVLERLAADARTVLTATSGDTGAAVAAAFWRRPGVRVVVLYPEGRIAALQERQLACLGENVLALAVQGTFDDCQRLVRACFADPALAAELALISANSINVARLLAQVLYFFETVAQLRRLNMTGAVAELHARGGRRLDEPPVIAVPSGNFGNLCAGLYARKLGLPVRTFVAATNANRTVPDFLDSGRYAQRPSVATLSNAMDVGDPSNWERIVHLHGGDWQALRRALRWGSLDDLATVEVLRRLWAAGYQADPHGAVAFGVLQAALQPGETGIFLATAHPAKFQEALAPLGLRPALPPRLAALLDRPLRRERLPADEPLLKARLRAGWG